MGVASYIKDGEDIKEVILESGILIKPVYGPEDIKDLKYKADLNDPGEYPFTRVSINSCTEKRPIQ